MPENDRFWAYMETRDDILRELSEIAPKLASMDKTNPYKLPVDYFNSFGSLLLDKIKYGEVKAELRVLAPELSRLNKPVAAEVPAAYFTGLSGKLIDKIRSIEASQELAEIAPALSKLEKVNAIAVPANYFKSLPQQVINKVHEQKVALEPAAPGLMDSVNSLFDRWIGILFKPKYTVAFAGIATTMIVAVMMFMKVEQCDDLDCRFAQLSTDEINNYLENKSDAYSDEVFEMNIGENESAADVKESTLHVYKDALKDVDDSALDAAIEN